MQEVIYILQEPWAIRALMASSMVGLMFGILGSFIVLRNMSLIGDALSHSILPGVFFAFLLFGYSTLGFFLGSVGAGLITAVLITWIQQNVKTKNDAAIGIIFTLMFSIGVIGISWLNNEQGVHLDLKDFLVGSIMGISNEDIILTLIVMLYTIISVILFYRYLFITTFQEVIASTMGISTKMVHYFLMLMLSFAIVAGLKVVGIILVVAFLITPSSTALLLSNNLKKVVIISGILGIAAAVFGLIGSIIYDTPPGPAMVCVSAFLYFIAALFAPEKGIITRFFRNRKQRNKIEKEDIIRQAIKHDTNNPLTIGKLKERLGINIKRLKSHIQQLNREGIIVPGKNLTLTAKGKAKADALVRAHRLWESYQVNTMGLNEAQIHDEADRLEHLLTEDLLDELDQKLGFPETDPHGSPIPKKLENSRRTLLYQSPNSRVKITKNQVSPHIESELWELGILPDTYITIKKFTDNKIYIRQGQKEFQVDADLAKRVLVS